MDKQLFNNLSLIEQVSYFNEKLQNGMNITQICSMLNISYNTIRDRFTRGLYSYNKLLNKYERVESIFPLNEDALEKALTKIVTKIFNNNSTNVFEEKLIIERRNCKVINRSFRIHESVLNDFIKYCELSNYSQYDILSQFITDGLIKYS